ncbi:MAG: MFS transporter [Clostridiales bacterium]|nr:MFS transporter [Clostridiales bacterium]
MFSFIRQMDQKRRTVLFTCFFAFFCNGSLSMTLGSVLPDLKAVYGLNDSVSGLFLSAHSAGNLIAGFLSGVIPLYLGEKRSIMMLSVLAFIGFIMMTLWGNPVWLLMAFLLTGLSRGSVTNFTNRMVNVLSGGNPAASNMLHASFAIGAIITPMAFLLLRTWIGWQAGVCFVIVCGLISLNNLRRMKLDKDRPDPGDKSNRSLSFLRNPSFLILAMMMFCYLCSEYALNGWLVTYIQNKESLLNSFGVQGKALSQAVAAYSQSMATLLWTVMLAGRLLCAALSVKVSQKLLMLVSSFGAAIFFTLMLLGGSITAVTLAVAGLGLCMAGICPMIYSDAALFTNTYPLATGALLAIGSSGAIAMPTVVGVMAEKFGFTGGMSAIMVTIVLLTVFSVLNVAVKTHVPAEAAQAVQQ